MHLRQERAKSQRLVQWEAETAMPMYVSQTRNTRRRLRSKTPIPPQQSQHTPTPENSPIHGRYEDEDSEQDAQSEKSLTPEPIEYDIELRREMGKLCDPGLLSSKECNEDGFDAVELRTRQWFHKMTDTTTFDRTVKCVIRSSIATVSAKAIKQPWQLPIETPDQLENLDAFVQNKHIEGKIEIRVHWRIVIEKKTVMPSPPLPPTTPAPTSQIPAAIPPSTQFLNASQTPLTQLPQQPMITRSLSSRKRSRAVTATEKQLERAEITRDAHRVAGNYILDLKDKWQCHDTLCQNLKFTCYKTKDAHYKLNPDDLERWNALINRNPKEYSVGVCPREILGSLLMRPVVREAKRKRRSETRSQHMSLPVINNHIHFPSPTGTSYQDGMDFHGSGPRSSPPAISGHSIRNTEEYISWLLETGCVSQRHHDDIQKQFAEHGWTYNTIRLIQRKDWAEMKIPSGVVAAILNQMKAFGQYEMEKRIRQARLEGESSRGSSSHGEIVEISDNENDSNGAGTVQHNENEHNSEGYEEELSPV